VHVRASKLSCALVAAIAVVLAGCGSPDAVERGDARLAEGRPDEALKLYQSALEGQPNSTELLVRVATAQSRLGNLDGAEKTMLQAAALAPDSPKVLQNLGLVYLKRHRLEEALAAFERVVAVEETYPLANYYIGLIHEMRGDAKTAARFYTRDVNAGMSPAMLRLLAYKENQQARGGGLERPSTRSVFVFCFVVLVLAAGAYALRLRIYRNGA